ncbi:MAG: iron-sulfur cluster assembly scaffold protein [Firmicutes bacterium]|nr:iron-sulfur cluster assembly scaffold protein [Bacillota bacterium]
MDGKEDAVTKRILALGGEYTETVRDHAINPRNVGSISRPDGFGEATGVCGDTMAIWLRVAEGRITEATFWTDGCGPTIACGSMVTELVKGKTVWEAWQIDEQLILSELGGLPEESTHCAALAVTTLRRALEDYVKLQREPWRKAYRQAR